MRIPSTIGVSVIALALNGLFSVPAFAQNPESAAAPTDNLGEILVTARKREESSLEAPLAISVFSARTFEQKGITAIVDIARYTPGLVTGESTGSIGGGSIYIRGIGAGETNALIEQAVIFNIDGVPISRSSIQRLGLFDLARAEVLKGPQSLYYGRNAIGGIIALVSADPTAEWDAKIKGSYEPVANEFQGEAAIGGPLTDSLGIRLAVYGDDMDGWVTNDTVPNATTGSYSVGVDSRNPAASREWGTRLTLKFHPTGSPLTVRLKGSHSSLINNGRNGTSELIFCPAGRNQFPGAQVDDCTANHHNTIGDPDPAYGTFDPKRFRNGRFPFLSQKQTLLSGEIGFDLSKSLTLTSVTGYYDLKARDAANWVDSSSANYGANGAIDQTDFTQEVRLTSSFESPFNFMLGGQYIHSKTRAETAPGIRNATTGAIAYLLSGSGPFNATQNTNGYSVFGQATYDITDTIDISGGARYTHERKTIDYVALFATAVNPAGPIKTAVPRRTFTNTSPEVTLRWRPAPRTNLYASYKYGFQSGGFNAGFGNNFANNLSYGAEKIKGPEAGVKTVIGRDLRLDVAAYYYKVTGLQITQTVGVTSTVVNVGDLRSKGIEASAIYSPHAIAGLHLNLGASYNHARYRDFVIDCYTGQTVATGCTLPNRKQNLAGTQAVRAPDWRLDAGVSYDAPLAGTGLTIGFSADATYSGGYWTEPRDIPGSRQRNYTIYNAGVRMGGGSGLWEAAIIGKNLGDKLYVVRSVGAPFTPTAGSGTALQDVLGGVSRGREVRLQLTLRPFAR